MAEKVGSGHNLKECKSDPMAAAREIARIEGEMSELREQIGEIKRAKVKPYMNLAEFNIAKRYWLFDDADERNTALDNLRVAFEALDIGGQMEMFGGTGGQESAA